MEKIFETIAGWFGVSNEVGSYIFYGACALVAILLVVIIVAIAKSASKKKAKAKTQTATPVQVKEEPKSEIKEEVKPEVKEEPKPEVKEEVKEVAETPAPAKVEEKPEVKAEEKKEEKPVAKKPVAKKAEAKPVEKKAEKAEVKEEPKPVAKKPVAKKGKAEVKEEKSEPAKVEEKTAEKKVALGKWFVEQKSDDEFIAKLSASNGEVMLSSEIYTTADGARNGINTIIKAVENGDFIIYRDKGGDYYYKLKSAANKFLCAGEIYRTKTQCNKSVESVKRIASLSPVTKDIVDGERYIEYTPEKNPQYPTEKRTAGKWKVEETEGGFSARLYASNGQLMLGTEGVSTKSAAEKSMENVKVNSAKGNFIIDRDKFGRFYYKLRNDQKSVICIGEAYDTVDGCINALESVRRFSATAIYSQE